MIQKGILFGCAIVIAMVVVFGISQEAPHTNTELIEAMAQAEADQKFILIDFYATWCGPCKTFTADSKKDPQMISSLEDVVFLKVNAESPDGRELAKRFRVNSYPTFVILDSTGDTQTRWEGYGKGHFLQNFDAAIYE